MIGLIFGETNFPKEILRKIKKIKIRYLIIDLTKKKLFKKDVNSYKVSIGQFGKIIKILKANNCKNTHYSGADAPTHVFVVFGVYGKRTAKAAGQALS